MRTIPVLFDANGRFGAGINTPTAHPRAADLLAHLDRLGVARSVVWHTSAATDHLPTANARLLEQIALNGQARNRLIPAFGFSAQMLYEHGAVDALAAMITSKSGSRALRFKAVYANTLRLVEPVLTKLADLRPVVFVSFAELKPDDLLAVAARLPTVSFVVTDVMWPQYIETFDLMRQRANVLVETSLLHTWNAIAIAVREFGAERILFGMGAKTHNGAAIAALMDASITPAERSAIAHGNLERLLGLGPLPAAKAVRSKSSTSLWTKLLQGRKLGVDIVDAHYHLGGSGGFVLETNNLREQITATLKKADALGVRLMLVSGLEGLLGPDPIEGHQKLVRALRPHRRRLRPYFGFNPRFADILAPRLGQIMRDFAGFKTLCDYWAVNIADERFRPMWEHAQAHCLPILNHTWEGTINSPAMLKAVVKRYPRAIFLLGHSGGGDTGRAEAEELAAAHANVYLEWCGSFCSATPWEDTLRRVSTGKVVYGSDAYCHGVPWELGRLLSLNLPDAALVPVLSANMRRILALDRRR
ncbi:MAG: amidohydrolase family protein [Lentisphaerae bacterium]|nr:amidohydrolase family protein [Lentisphaerota bacterium]